MLFALGLGLGGRAYVSFSSVLAKPLATSANSVAHQLLQTWTLLVALRKRAGEL